MLEHVTPMDRRIGMSLDALVRQCSSTSNTVDKMKDLYNLVASCQEQISQRPLKEEIKSQFDRLSGYVQIETFRTLQSVVHDKVDFATFDEQKFVINHLQKRLQASEDTLAAYKQDLGLMSKNIKKNTKKLEANEEY